MKITTWIDRLAGVILALAIAHILGPEALGEWTLILIAVWILSPWPEETLATRLGAGLLGLAGVAVVDWLWTGGWERHALLWIVAVGMFSVRIVHALPAPWRLRLAGSACSFLAGFIALGVTKSLLATSLALALTASLAALIGSILYRAKLGKFSPISLRIWTASLVMMVIQSQAMLWVYARGFPSASLGHLAAALFMLEFLKGGLVLVALRFDAVLTRFAQTRESFLETVRSITAYSFLIMPPTVILVYFVTAPLVNTLLGPAFADSIPLVRILIWGFGFSFLSLMGARVLAVKNISAFTARLAGGLLEAGLDAFWIPQMGLEGACYGRVAGEALSFILITLKVLRLVPDLVNPFRKTYG